MSGPPKQPKSTVTNPAPANNNSINPVLTSPPGLPPTPKTGPIRPTGKPPQGPRRPIGPPTTGLTAPPPLPTPAARSDATAQPVQKTKEKKSGKLFRVNTSNAEETKKLIVTAYNQFYKQQGYGKDKYTDRVPAGSDNLKLKFKNGEEAKKFSKYMKEHMKEIVDRYNSSKDIVDKMKNISRPTSKPR